MICTIFICFPQVKSFLFLTTLRTGCLIIAFLQMAFEAMDLGYVGLGILLDENMLEGSEYTAEFFGTRARLPIQPVAVLIKAVLISAVQISLIIGVMKHFQPNILFWLIVSIITFVVVFIMSVVNVVRVTETFDEFDDQLLLFMVIKTLKDYYFMVVVKSYYYEEKKRGENDLVVTSSRQSNTGPQRISSRNQ